MKKNKHTNERPWVYVQGPKGNALMPTQRCCHVRLLLKAGRAIVVKQKPFIIRPLYETPEITQDLWGGTDPGRTNIGEAVVDTFGNTVYQAQVESCNRGIPKHMKKRAAHRRASRQGERKARQRKATAKQTVMNPPEQQRILPKCKEPITIKVIRNTEARFANRKRPKGWLTPTARQCVQTHLNMVDKICSVLPVTDWTLEANKFAFMRMEDGGVKGIDFQNGRLKGYASVQDYVFEQQEGKCALCDKPIQHYHHIVPRHEGGSDGPENIVGLCASCHATVHQGKSKKTANALKKLGKKKKWSALAVLNQAIPYILEGLIERFGEDHVHICSGWDTATVREAAGITKTHANDAAVIAYLPMGLIPQNLWKEPLSIKQFRRHDRAIIKAQTERTYQLNGDTVAKNRRPRFEQQKPSLQEYRASLPVQDQQKVVSRLTVQPSSRRYNDLTRHLPGTVFYHEGHRYVKRGQQRGGKALYAVGVAEPFNAKQCKIVPAGGLVYL